MRVVSVAQMRELERQTFAAGVSEDELQRRAGAEVAAAVARRWPHPARVVAVVGAGNNGRDAWIAAQRLLEQGWGARLYLSPRHSISPREVAEFQGRGGGVVEYAAELDDGGLVAALEDATVALDGLLGIGASGPPRPPLDRIIAGINRARAARPSLTVVAVDIPSGLDPDSGEAPGAVVHADLTVVLGGLKQGLLASNAAQFTGELVAAEIGVVPGPAEAPEVVTVGAVQGLLPPRPPEAHKGAFGRLLVVAGSELYVGAAYLTCAAAVRAGAGIVTLAAPRWLRDVVAGRLAETVYLPLPDRGPAGDPGGCLEAITARLPGFDALAIGPGLSTEGGVARVVRGVLQAAGRAGLPMVVDADGLNCLAPEPDWRAWLGGQRAVLTPHPGELARLLGGRLPQDEPAWRLAQRLGQEWRLTLVVKGGVTAIGSPQGAGVHPRPNPALATAGTGDVLTGLIGGLLARGLEPLDAARLGVWAHGEAGARASRGLAAGGLAASDLLAEIPPALAQAVGPRPP